MGGILGLAVPKWALYALVAVAVVVVLGIVEHRGYVRGKAELAEYALEQAEASLRVMKATTKVVTEVETKYVERIRVVREKGETITREVPVYVTKSDDAACELRAGGVRAHDASATGNAAGPASDADRAPSGVALSEALSVVASNYATCRALREQVLGWQEFYAKLQAEINERAK